MSEIAIIDICICTYRRTSLLRRLLVDLTHLETENRFRFRIIVSDNDTEESARSVVEEFTALHAIQYCVEPVRNIARARNLVVSKATADLVALIDDDETPGANWLLLLLQTLEREEADGVLGPVVPLYPEQTPEWFRKAGFYNFRQRHPTGQRLHWHECRTGNALLRRNVLAAVEGPFRPEFGTGGEDQDFFRRAIEQGYHFLWCDEALVHERIEPSRWQRKVLLKRALLRGKNTFRHKTRRWYSITKALVAVPLYLLLLPLALVKGQHAVMRVAMNLCAHVGLLLAAIRLNPLSERPS